MRIPILGTYVRANKDKPGGVESYTVEHAPTDKNLLAIHAERLINDSVLMMVFEAIERDLTATWRNSPLGQKDQREEAYRLVWALAQVKSKLQELLADKKMLEHEQKQKELRDARERERRAA